MKKNILFLFAFVASLLFNCNTEIKNDTMQPHEIDRVVENVVGHHKTHIPTKETVDKFYDAINNNETEKALAMVGTDFPGDYEPAYKITPLQAAIWRNNMPLVQKLVEHHANINKKDASAVEEASEYGMYEILEYLIQQKGSVDNAAFSKAKDYRCAKLLLENKANQNMGDVSRKLNFYLEAVEKNDISFLKLVEMNKDDRNYNNCNGETALIIAIKNEHIELIKYLLESGVDVKKPETFDCGDDIYMGKTPLELAIETSNKEIIALVQNATKNQ